MKKQKLLNIMDDELLEKLFGFCYARTRDGYEAQELCSDIIYALVKASHTDGEIENLYPFIWRVARNVYADFSNVKKRRRDMFYEGDADDILPFKEHAAKAVACGYLYREGKMLYTKILVNDMKDMDRLFDISHKLSEGYFEAEAQVVAEKISELITSIVPGYLLGDWLLANRLANMPVLDLLAEILIEKGFLIPPEDGIGAEGCWMSVAK